TINLTGGAATFNSLTENLTGTTPSVTINGNLTLALAGATLTMTNGNFNMNGNLTFSSTSATFTLTSGVVNMGNNVVTYSTPSAGTGSLSASTGNCSSYFAFLGNNGGFQWNMNAVASPASPIRYPIGIGGTGAVVTGFRPVAIKNSVTTSTTTNVKVGFI